MIFRICSSAHTPADVREFYMTTQQWPEKLVDEQIVRLYNTTEVSNFSELDLTSIMMCVLKFAATSLRLNMHVTGTSCRPR